MLCRNLYDRGIDRAFSKQFNMLKMLCFFELTRILIRKPLHTFRNALGLVISSEQSASDAACYQPAGQRFPLYR